MEKSQPLVIHSGAEAKQRAVAIGDARSTRHILLASWGDASLINITIQMQEELAAAISCFYFAVVSSGRLFAPYPNRLAVETVSSLLCFAKFIPSHNHA